MTGTLSEREQAVIDALPAGSMRELADAVDIALSTAHARKERINDLDGHSVEKANGEWVYDGPADDQATDTAANPSPDNLSEREEYIVRQLQTGVAPDDLVDELQEPRHVVESRIDTLAEKGWSIYHDADADLFELDGDHVLRSSEHKGTRTRKANRWWEVRHSALERQWKKLDTPTVSLSAAAGNEDWVTHLTDLHAGDLVRGYDDSIVHETEDLPPIIDHITERSLALSQKHGSTYDTAYLLWGGDFVTNEGIYEGQHENLDAWLDEQMDTLHDPLLRQIKTFAEHFDQVVVVGQAGNHGDIRANGSSKQANADLLLYKSIRNTVGALAEAGVLDNVGFKIGRAGSPTPFWLRDGAIHGQLRHGQDRKPQATTSARKKEWLSTVIDSLNFGQAVDMIWMGHYHVSGRIPWNGPPIFVTASPLPVGEYPRKLGEVDGLNEPDIATCHGVSDDGVTGVYPIDPRHFDPAEYVNIADR